jgi:hypothetical protein
MTRLQSLMTRVFGPEKNYRVISEKTGPGVEWTHRFRWTAAYRAVCYEYTEWRAGLPQQNWIVQKKA